MAQDTEALSVTTIDDNELDVACQYTYLGSTITDNLSMDRYIDKRTGKAPSTVARLTARVLVDKPDAVGEDKYCCLQCLRYQHTVVWQSDIGYIRQPGETTQQRPTEKHPSYAGNILPSIQLYPQTMHTAMVVSCPLYVWRVVASTNTSFTVI